MSDGLQNGKAFVWKNIKETIDVILKMIWIIIGNNITRKKYKNMKLLIP